MYYYSADGTKFSSKIEALEYGKNKKQKIQFHYYDNLYEKLNWSIEPPESLDYYYLEQAKRIRDSYDYVILCYSGGYDSSNILETFHFNNLRLDKIVTVGAFNEDNLTNSDENHNGEIYHNVFPYLKELNLESITQVVDYSKLFENIKNFSINKYDSNWVDHMGGWFSPHNWFWRDLEKYVVPPEYKNKKVAIIFGRDKPSLFSKMMLRTDKLDGFYFRDTPVTSYGNVSAESNCDRINFYWDPNYPLILLKQLHVLRKYHFIKRMDVKYLPHIPVNDIVYNLRRKILFKSPKSPTNILSLRDNFLKHKQNNDVYSLYEKGISEIKHRLGDERIKPTYSRFYDLTKNVQE
jgi:hypothetical protein